MQKDSASRGEECARIMAMAAYRLALPEGDPYALTRTSAAVFLREQAERIQREEQFDRELPPWPDDAPEREEWLDYAMGKKR